MVINYSNRINGHVHYLVILMRKGIDLLNDFGVYYSVYYI